MIAIAYQKDTIQHIMEIELVILLTVGVLMLTTLSIKEVATWFKNKRRL